MEKTPPLHEFLDLMSVEDIEKGRQPHVRIHIVSWFGQEFPDLDVAKLRLFRAEMDYSDVLKCNMKVQ